MLKAIYNRIRLFVLCRREPYSVFYNMFGICPRDISLFEQACRHRSAARLAMKGQDNERLEFLGDAVLGTIVADLVYSTYDAQREGFLSSTRSKIVKRETLNHIAIELGIDKIVEVNTHNIAHNNYMYGNALEALVGAIYIDQGYEQCRKIVEERIIRPYIDLKQIANEEVNFKSRLIEWCQRYRVSYDFVIDKSTHDEHNNPVFHACVMLAGVSAGEGMGYTKKEAQQHAASMALKRIARDRNWAKELYAKPQKECAEAREFRGEEAVGV